MRPRPHVLAAVALLACQGRAPTPREELLRAGVEPTPAAFADAAARGDLRLVRLFLAAGLDPGAEDAVGRTPLVAAAGGGSLEAARLLLDAGASVRECTRSPAPGALSPLFAAAVRGDVAMAELLLERGADPEQACGETTPGDEAARFGRTGVVRLLASRGARITADPLRERAREAAARLRDSAEALRGSFVARGEVVRVLSRDGHPEAVERIAAGRYFLAQLLAVRLGGREVILATNQTRFELAGPFSLRVRPLGPTPTPRGEVELLVEDVHHESALYLHGRLRAARDAAFVAYAASQLPAAFERADAAGPAQGPLGRTERALLALPEVIAAELDRVEERSGLGQQLLPFVRALVHCRLRREHRLAFPCEPEPPGERLADADRARLEEALWEAAAGIPLP